MAVIQMQDGDFPATKTLRVGRWGVFFFELSQRFLVLVYAFLTHSEPFGGHVRVQSAQLKTLFFFLASAPCTRFHFALLRFGFARSARTVGASIDARAELAATQNSRASGPSGR